MPTDAEYSGVWFADSLNGWVTGGGREIEGGIVGRTRDGGRTWRFTTGVLPYLQAGFGLHRAMFRDTLQGWAAADGGYVMHTRDGGQTWAVLNEGMSGGPALSDVRVDGDQIWAAGSSRVIYSSDAGATWSVLSMNNAESDYRTPNAVQFLSTANGFMVTNTGQLLRTNDGGAEWSPVPIPIERAGPHAPLPSLRDLFFINDQQGWIVGDEGVILESRDGGASWQRRAEGVPIERLGPDGRPAVTKDVVPELDTPAEKLTLSRVRFADPQRGWAVGYYLNAAESLILGTDDGGAHWRVEHRVQGELLTALDVLDARHAWAAGDRARTEPQCIVRFGRPDPGAR